MKHTCKCCKYRLDQGPHQLCKCRITGLKIENLQDSCLAWKQKESPSGAGTPDEEQG